ncbi:MAG: dihydropyrimidinase [Anaerolineae bacterium]|nr:dihydropyrimidinase [Anaerolineae bacterium]
MKAIDLVIKGGTLINASEVIEADIGISDEKIALIGKNLEGKEIIDAGGLYVLPGAVDPHVHLEMPAGITTSSDDWQSGSIAAACGGTTTLIDFVEPENNQSLREAYMLRRQQAENKSVLDFGLHMTITNSEQNTLSQLPDLIEQGITSFKLYTTYTGFKLDDTQLLKVLNAIHKLEALAIVHSENDAIIQWRTQDLLKTDLNNPASHPLSRPETAEREAIHRILSLAEITRAFVYIVHISTRQGAEMVCHARLRGQKAFGETCPQYLLLDHSLYQQPDFEGAKFVCSPPLRKKSDTRALWQALSNGTIQVAATDHCPFFFKGQKDLGKDNFSKIPGGLPGVGLRLSLMYSYGVCGGHLSLNRWVETCSTAAARLFGLYPRKGCLLPGADADIVLFDPHKILTVRKDILHENVDYTPYEGMQLKGYPVMTIKGGKPIAKDGTFLDTKITGKYLARKLPDC